MPAPTPDGFKHVLSKKYVDQVKLYDYLENEYPRRGNYTVQLKGTRYLLWLPHQLTPEQLEGIAQRVKVHYNQ